MLDYFGSLFAGLGAVLPFTAAGQDPFIFMMIGIAIGFAVGILPGLGGATTLALMLPFIYKMDPTTAFAFLLGSHAVTATTGDITSVLFGVPGEGITAATIVDGHAMAKRGEAGRALGAALMSSLIGAIFGAFALALAIPIVQPLVLSIGAPEFLMLSLLGITFLASLSGGNLAKGLTAGGFGLVLAMVGLDAITSVSRYTLEPILGSQNVLFLWDGLSLVAVTVGLFAIPEIIELGTQGSSIARDAPSALGGVMQGVRDTFRHWKLVLRCSAIGTYIGLIPGLGGGPAQWVAYAHAVQSGSSDQTSFGQGAVEGVLGPGAANNSKEGGSLVPTIAFGVPGSVGMAILLGAFIIQGIVPGPDLLNPHKHLNLTFSFVWIIVLSNIVTVAISFLFLKQLARITFVKGTYLIPFLLLLIFLGGFAVKNSFGDMIVVLLFGAVGWLMIRNDWQRPPLLLGLVLGGIADNNLFLTSKIYGMSWVTRPGVIVIGLMIAGALLYPLWQARRQRRPLEAAAEGPAGEGHEDAGPPEGGEASKSERTLFAGLFVALFVYVVYEALYGFGAVEKQAALFPLAVGLPSLALAILALIHEFRLPGPAAVAETAAIAAERALLRRRTVGIVCWTVGFFLTIWLLGFITASAVATLAYLKLGAGEKWGISIALTAVAWGFFFGLFDYGLHLPFPPGELFVWLGVA